MKITKRIVSVVLALILVFGNLSLVASAAASDAVTINFKYYREVNGEWIETKTIARGDTVKARMFIKTSFTHESFAILFAYPSSFMTHEYTHLEQDAANELIYYPTMNAENAQVSSNSYELNVVNNSPIIKEQLTDDGGGEYEPYLPESFFDENGWFNSKTESFATPFALDDSDWVAEYQFKVNDNATGNGYVFVPKEAIMAPGEQEAAFSYIFKKVGNKNTGSMNEAFTWNVTDPEDFTKEEMLSLDNTVTFNDGTNAVTSTGYIGDKLAAENIPADPAVSGKVFLGWVPSTVENPTETDVVDVKSITYDYEATTYNALYKSADKVVTVNANYTDLTTNTAAVADKEFETTIGNTVKIVEKLPETPEEKTTYILYSDLPTVPNYEFDAANTPAENLTFVVTDADAVMNVNYKPVDYTATFEPANGDVATEIVKAYYSDITAPDAPSKANSKFTGWSNGTETIQPGDTFKLEGNVTYTAQYENVYNVTYTFAGEKMPEGVDAPAAGTTTAGSVIAAPTVDVPDGWTIEWTATGATKNDDGSYTAGANDVVFTGTWAKIPYGVTYVYAGATPDGYNAPNAIELTVGDAIEEPEVTVPAGYELVWTMSGDVDGKMGTAPVTMTGTWTKIPYDVVYNYAGDVPAGATEPADTTATVGETITLATPAAEGYTFKGWTVEGADYNAETGVVTVGTSAVTITGTWAKNYLVTYQYVGSGDYPEKVPALDAPEAETVISGDTVVVPENPSAPGYNFIEWTVEGASYDAETDSYIVDGGDVTVTGTWEAIAYKYRYYLDDEKTVLFTTKTYTYGDVPVEVALPTDEQLTAKGFEGWTADFWDIDTPESVTGNLDFVLSMYQYEYLVEFYNRDDKALDLNNDDTAIVVLHGETVDPSIVVESADVEGYTATGSWHIGDADGEIATFPYAVKEDTAFYADYKINQNKIIYYADEEGKAEFTSFTVDYNTVISEDHVPADKPAKEGYTFTAWIEETTGSEIEDYLGNNMPDNDVKVYPTFTINEYTITWVIDGKEQSAPQTYGEKIIAPKDPAKEGYTFKGWATSENGAVITDLGTVPANNDTKFYAVFAGDSDIAYTINKYFMNTDGTYEGVDAVPETAYGVAGTEVTYEPAAETGFTFDATQANVLEGTVAGDGSLKLAVYYSRNKVNVTINDNTEEMYYGETITEPTVTPDGDPGYEFDKWVDEDDNPVIFPVEVGTDPIVIKPTFKAETDTEYIVEIYLMDTEGNYADTPDSTETKTGTTDTEATYTPVAKEGFTADAESYKTTIKADTSDTIKVYYSRNKVNVTINDNTEEMYYGETITEPAETPDGDPGYEFDKWVDENGDEVKFPVTVGTEDIVIKPTFKAETSTEYLVEIYEMNLSGKYELVDTLKETGETDTEATYTPAAKEGFTADAESYKTIIKADTSDTIKVYYSRNKVNVTINDDTEEMYYGETITEPTETPDGDPGYSFDKWVDENGDEVKFPVTIGTEDIVIEPTFKKNAYPVVFMVNGSEYAKGDKEFESAIVAPEDPTAAGYEFLGWSLTEKGEIVDPETKTVPVDGITFYAVFKANSNTAYTVKKFFMNEEGNDWMAPVDETRYAETDSTVTLDFAAEKAEGFTIDEANSDKSKVIAGNGSTVLVIYYNRNTVKVTINGTTTDEYYGTEIEEPAAPKADAGYTFGGWTYEDGAPVEFPVTVETTDITIVPVWNKLSYNLTFKDAAGNVISGPTSTEFDADITAPEVDDKEGYTFIGWIAEVTGEKFNGKMPAKDVVYIETWNDGNYVPYKVETWIMNLDGDYELTTEAYGSALTGNTQGMTANEIPGFSIDTEKSVLSAVIVGDGSTVLKAYYARDKYTVTFDGENAQQIFFGEALPVVEPDEQTGKTFSGWVVKGTNEKAPATMPANDVDLASTWTDTEYTITFIVEGKIIATDKYNYGDAVTAPETPEVYGKKFVEWAPAVPETMPAENLIISAIFDSAVYKVTFVDFDGNAFVEMQVRAGDAIVLPVEEPTKEFYVFKGWLDVPGVMPSEDITIKPDFERVPVVLVPEEGSTTVIDRENMVIYGLEIFLDEDLIDEYLAVEGDGYYTVTPVANGCYGTGTVIEVYDRYGDGTPLETFHIVIFGDLNGDARVNAVDTAMADDESLMLTDWSLKQTYKDGELVDNENYKVYMAMAADINGKDGRIDATDVSDIRDTSLLVVDINQVEGIVER